MILHKMVNQLRGQQINYVWITKGLNNGDLDN